MVDDLGNEWWLDVKDLEDIGKWFILNIIKL